jgi:hypothetical protein
MALPPGVPALAINIAFEAVKILTSDGLGLSGQAISGPWGLYDQQGNPVLTGDSVLAFDFDQDAAVATYPVEKGGFESYNKVQTPYRTKFTFTKGGTESDRKAFLGVLNAVLKSTDPLVGMTPEVTYPSVTADHADFRRSARQGVTLLKVDVWLQEIRVAPALDFSNATAATPPLTDTADPEAKTPTNTGPVQATAPAPQSITPAGAQSSGQGSITSAAAGSLRAPPTLTAPLVYLTSSLGNVVPPPLASPVQAAVTYLRAGAPASGIVSGVITGALGQVQRYALSNGVTVPVNTVSHILPPGFTQVQ